MDAEKRLEICRSCPLYMVNSMGWEICNPQLYLDPETGAVSRIKKNGWYRGCGCIVHKKVNNPFNSCGAGKW